MTKKSVPTQTDLEPTEIERKKIWSDVIARNADRTARGLPEREVTLMFELGLTRHRAQKYQDLLAPYLEFCLTDIQKSDVSGPSPADYHAAVALAEAQLRDATGIVSPRTKMTSEVANMARHRT